VRAGIATVSVPDAVLLAGANRWSGCPVTICANYRPGHTHVNGCRGRPPPQASRCRQPGRALRTLPRGVAVSCECRLWFESPLPDAADRIHDALCPPRSTLFPPEPFDNYVVYFRSMNTKPSWLPFDDSSAGVSIPTTLCDLPKAEYLWLVTRKDLCLCTVFLARAMVAGVGVSGQVNRAYGGPNS